MSYLNFIFIAFSQLINTILGGYPDETLSAMFWRKDIKIMIKIVNLIFFWQNNHCRGAYNQEVISQHQAEDYRK